MAIDAISTPEFLYFPNSMIKLLSITAFALSLLGLLALRTLREQPRVQQEIVAIGCAAPVDPTTLRPDVSGRYAPVFPGWGHYHYPVRTTSDSAQLFFDQGLSMYYSYHLTEALASFKEAARQDPGCVMAYWGQALAMGPYYNSYGYKMPAAVLPVLEQMDRVGSTAAGKEKDLIEAIDARYSPDTSDAGRTAMNRTYAVKMADLIRKYPSDPDIKALYVDAVMLEHVWDFWETDGTPKPWTNELVAYCDDILKDYPTHPAALHYQIHLVEASRHPEKALPNAALLASTMPGVSHMVHMASHMYQRSGLYAQGVDINYKAIGLQRRYDSMAPGLKIGLLSLQHFDAVGSFCAMNANMYQRGHQLALDLRKQLPASRMSNTFLQYLYMMPVLASVRSGKWGAVVAEPQPDSSLCYALALYNFGKGMACVRLHDTVAAGLCLAALRSLRTKPSLGIRNLPFNAPFRCAAVAEGILAGELAYAEGRPEEAIHLLEQAVTAEDELIYREPKEWPIPARHYLGACLLKLHKAAEAGQVFQKDLILNPGNGWAYLGLYQSLVMQHKADGARKYQVAYTKAFAGADEIPPGAAY